MSEVKFNMPRNCEETWIRVDLTTEYWNEKLMEQMWLEKQIDNNKITTKRRHDEHYDFKLWQIMVAAYGHGHNNGIEYGFTLQWLPLT